MRDLRNSLPPDPHKPMHPIPSPDQLDKYLLRWFFQVFHQQVADRAAGQPVAADQLGRRPLPAGAQLPQRRRSPRPEDAHRVQGPVEQVRRPNRSAVRIGLGL